jgi:hypothetical protein
MDGLHLKLVSKARSSSKFHPIIREFRAGLSIGESEPFAYIDIPEVKANAETDIIVEQDIKFESMELFTEYTMTVMGSESFVVNLDGKTKIKQSGLEEIDVDYNKKVEMKGTLVVF